MSSAYSTAVEGSAEVSVRYTIRGRLDGPSYIAFVAERAKWFGVRSLVIADHDAIVLRVSGPEAMVGALEMACTLGPINALIENVEAVDESKAAALPAIA
jgi:acylphosphatase